MQTTIQNGAGWDMVVLGTEITHAEIDELEELLQRFLTIGHYNVILDLTHVAYIGSAGISLLLRYTNAFRRWERGDLLLAELPDTILNLFEVAGLVSEERSHLSVYPSVDAAKEAVKKRAS